MIAKYLLLLRSNSRSVQYVWTKEKAEEMIIAILFIYL